MAFFECVPKYKQESSALPAGYQRCLYLESSGKQYINTGVTSDSFVSITIDAEFTSLSPSFQFIFGFNYSTETGIQAGAMGSKITARYGSYYTNEVAIETGKVYRYIVGSEIVSFDGQVLTTPSARVYPTDTLRLFVRNDPSGTYPAYVKISYINVKMDEKIYNEFIPCLDESGKPGLYSTQLKEMFYNATTGEFGYELMDGTYVSPTTA